MKNFFTAVPLQKAGQLSKYVYNAIGNEKLNFEKPIYFPIFSAIAGYVEKGEEFQLVAVVIDNEDCKNKMEFLAGSNPRMLEEMGMANKILFDKKFSIDVFGEKYVELINALMC